MGEGFVEDFDIVVEIPKSQLVDAERGLSGITHLVNERPDHIDQDVIAVEYGLNAVTTWVGHLNASFSNLSNGLLNELYLHCPVTVSTSVFVGGFPTGWGAVQARPTRGLRILQHRAAADALGG